jgi:hypothetical protein
MGEIACAPGCGGFGSSTMVETVCWGQPKIKSILAATESRPIQGLDGVLCFLLAPARLFRRSFTCWTPMLIGYTGIMITFTFSQVRAGECLEVIQHRLGCWKQITHKLHKLKVLGGFVQV